MPKEIKELMTEQEQQELIRAISLRFRQNLGQLFPKMSQLSGKISDFPADIRGSMAQFREKWGQSIFVFYSTWDQIKEYFDIDVIHFSKPIKSPHHSTAVEEQSIKGEIRGLRDSWKSYLSDRFIPLEFAWDKISEDLHADLSDVPSPIREEINSFRLMLKTLTKKSAHQFISGLDKYPVGHPERHIYLRFWISSIANRFLAQSSESVDIGMSLMACPYADYEVIVKYTIRDRERPVVIAAQQYWDEIQSLFLEHYPWNLLMSLGAYRLFWAMNGLPEPMRQWLHAYAKPLVARHDLYTRISDSPYYHRNPEDDSENRMDDLLYRFCDFFFEYFKIIDRYPLSKISPPPDLRMSFTVRSDYLKRVLCVLEKSNKPEYQIENLDNLPSMKLIQYAHQQNFNGVITKDLFLRDTLPIWVKTNVSANGVKQKLLLQDIQRKADLNTYTSEILCWVSLFKPDYFAHVKSFSNDIDDRIIANVVSICLLSTQSSSMHLLPAFNVLASRLRDEYGAEIVEQILALQTNQSTDVLSDFVKIAELFLDLVDYFNAQLFQRSTATSQTLLKTPEDVFLKFKSLSEVITCLQDLQRQYWAQRFPEKTVEQLRHDFLTPSEMVKTPLSSDEFELLISQCEQIDALGKTYFGISLLTLGNRASALGKKSWFSDSDKIELIAIIREVIRQEFKILPHKTQLLAVLGMLNYPRQLKGRIAQMKTGEGKSTVVTILATFLACRGRFIDVITVNHSLAMRDQEKYKNYYAYFGLRCSHICDRHPTKEAFDAEIIFGTNYDFEFSYLFESLGMTHVRGSRPCDIALVDEVDSLMIDSAMNSARIANASSVDVSWVYQPILLKLQELGEERFSSLSNAQMRSILSHYQQGFYANIVADLTDTQIVDWQTHAVEVRKKIAGFHYVITHDASDHADGHQKKQIVIMDNTTGHQSKGCQWQGGLHQFVQIQNGIAPSPENNTIAALSHPAFFGLYPEIYGLTGTVGESVEREEIESIYHVGIFDVPTHRLILRQKELGGVATDKDQHYGKIIASIKLHRAKGQPILILFNNVNESNEFTKKLRSEQVDCLVLNGVQKEDEKFIIARAGVAGQVTVATNMAGRGTDIILSTDAKNAGGLHVIFAFYPSDIRVEEQGFGRAGRQGQPGTGEMILSFLDPTIIKLLQGKLLSLTSNEPFTTILNRLRTEAVQAQSTQRKSIAAHDTALFRYLSELFEELPAIQDCLKRVDRSEIMRALQDSNDNLSPNHFLISRHQPLVLSAISKISEARNAKMISDELIDYLRKTYVSLQLDHWAKWFTEVSHHRHRRSTIGEYEQFLESQHQQLYRVKRLEGEPGMSFCKFLHALANINMVSLSGDQPRTRPLPRFFAAASADRTGQSLPLANAAFTPEEKKQTVESIFQAINLNLSRLILVDKDFTGSIDKDFPPDMHAQMKRYREQWAKEHLQNWGRDWKKALIVLDDDTQMTKQSLATARDRFPLTIEDIDYVRGHWKWLITCCRQFEFLFDQWRKNFDCAFSAIRDPELKLSTGHGRELWPGTITGFRKEIFDSFRGAFSFLTKTSAEQCVAGLHQLDMFERYERLMHWMDAISCRYKKDNLIIPIFGGGWGFDKYTNSAVLIDDSVFWSVANTLFLSRYSWDRFNDFSQYALFHKINIFSETMVLWLKSYFNSQAMQNASKEKLSHAVSLFSDFFKAVKKRSDQSGFQLEPPTAQVCDEDLREIMKVGPAIVTFR